MVRFFPLLVLVFIGAGLAIGMLRGAGKNDYQSPLLGKKLADFSVPILLDDEQEGEGDFSSKMLAGKPAFINAFASWCEGCLAEHQTLMKLAAYGKVRIYGLAWKDKPEAVTEYLNKNGNPFTSVGLDASGKTTVALGLSGVPESFVIDKNGIVVFHFRSAITDEVLEKTILPLVEKLNND